MESIMSFIKIKSNKVCLFSDFHYGKNRNNVHKLNECDKFIDWMIEQCKERGIDTIFFLGDWFDDRNTISNLTLNHSWHSVKKISEAGFTFIMIVGNHDAYYKNSTDVNSLVQYMSLDNVHVISEATRGKFVGTDKTFWLFPWDSFTVDKEPADYSFGHFEYIGAKYSKYGIASDHGYTGESICNVAPLSFSGHYHTPKDYNYTSGLLKCIGTPLEQDWGDFNDAKYLHFLDTETNEIEHVRNTINSRHIKMPWSKFKDYILSNDVALKRVVNNNYIKLLIDTEYSMEDVVKATVFINSLTPAAAVQTEFFVAGVTSENNTVLFNAEDTFMLKTELEQSLEFANIVMDQPELVTDEQVQACAKTLDKQVLTGLIHAYFKQAELESKSATTESK